MVKFDFILSQLPDAQYSSPNNELFIFEHITKIINHQNANHTYMKAIIIIARCLIVYGLLVSVILLSDMVEIRELAGIREYAGSIFATNCSFIFNSADVCAKMSTLLLVFPIVSAILIALFYRSFTMVFTSMGLIVFALFFCNPQIDVSFTSFIHFIQVCICVSGLMFLAFKPNQQAQKN